MWVNVMYFFGDTAQKSRITCTRPLFETRTAHKCNAKANYYHLYFM